MRKILLFFMALAAATSVARVSAQSVDWGYYNGTQELKAWGTGKAETYYTAMKVVDRSLMGSQLTAVRVPLSYQDVTECAVWIGSELATTGNIVHVDFTPADELWTTIELPTPWVVDQEEFFVGVNLTAKSGQGEPFMLVKGGVENALFVKSSRTYRSWSAKTEAMDYSHGLQIVLEGDIIKDYAVGLTNLPLTRVVHDETTTVTATIANHGTEAVTDVDWEYTLNGQQVSGQSEVTIASDYYGQKGEFSFEIPANSQFTDYTGELVLTKVNGQANKDITATMSHTVRVLSNREVHRAVMEEYTGLWCGWCPRGYVGMQQMALRHPDEFIGLAYHYDDQMQSAEKEAEFPNIPHGYPAVFFDRTIECDSYYGIGYNGSRATANSMEIDSVWQAFCAIATPANVYVNARLNEDGNTIEVDSRFEFCEAVGDAQYGIAYVISADGLSDPSWLQSNNYAGDEDFRDGLLDPFVDGDGYVQGLVYDDVVVATSHTQGESFEGVIPSQLNPTDEFTHSTIFNIDSMICKSKKYLDSAIVQDENHLNAIALLIDVRTKQIVNSAKAPVITNETAIKTLGNDALNASRSYNLNGQSVAASSRGIIIERAGDGSVRKVMNL